jgi:hypothetical protein
LNSLGIQPDSGDDSYDEDSSSKNKEETLVQEPNGSKVHRSPNEEISDHTEITEQTGKTETKENRRKSKQTEQISKTERKQKRWKIEKSEQTGLTVKTVNNIKSTRSIELVKKPKTESNQELARPLPSHYQYPMEIANRKSYYEPNLVNPVAGHYYDYQYNGVAPGPSQPIKSLAPKARDVPQEYPNGPPKEPYETFPVHYAKQQYYNQTFVDPGYYYYDYVPVTSKGSDFETLAYQNSNYQQDPEQYYYYTEGQANDNNNNRYPRSSPTIPAYSYSNINQASKNYGQPEERQPEERQKQEQAMYHNYDPSNNYSNRNNHYYKPG